MSTSETQKQPMQISFPEAGEKYKPLLKGFPETGGMRSGYVVLDPGEAVGLHSTEGNEEALVILTGQGELQSPGIESIQIQPGSLYYNPPHTPHDVVNTGKEQLCYIYVVCKAEKE